MDGDNCESGQDYVWPIMSCMDPRLVIGAPFLLVRAGLVLVGYMVVVDFPVQRRLDRGFNGGVLFGN